METQILLKFTNSNKLWDETIKLIPSGTQTLSKGPNNFVQGAYPIFLKSGNGSRVCDVDGNEFIEFGCALGPIVLGYQYPAVDEAIMRQLKQGINFSLMHPLEIQLAKLLVEVIPCAEMVRFGKNGADATSAAVKAARHFTGREKIAFCGYHGCQDWYAASTERDAGIIKALKDYIIPFSYNDIYSLQEVFDKNKDEIAAVIMEPICTIVPEGNFLNDVKELAHKNGALLIFDEVKTGFRFSLGGAQEYLNVIPDLACFGKAMANGMPLSAVVGRKDVMKSFEEVFFSTTAGGEALSLAAAIATINEIRNKGVIKHIWRLGKRFLDGFNDSAEENGVNAKLMGMPPLGFPEFRTIDGGMSLELKSLFYQETAKHGVLFGNGFFISYSHTDEDIDQAIDAFDKAFKIMYTAEAEGNINSYLEGKVAAEVFKKR